MKSGWLLISCLLYISLLSSAKTFTREYSYNAGEADSKSSSRAIALDQVKRILLEEIGVYLKSEFTTTKEENGDSYNEVSSLQIQSITGHITETKIIEEKWNGETYYIKASISVDPDEVSKKITAIGTNKNKLREIEDVKRKNDEAASELARLRKELANATTETKRLAIQKEYTVASEILSATDWFEKGYRAYNSNDLDNAIIYYQQAIKLNPNVYEVYNNLALSYKNKGYADKAIQYFEKAIELNPQNPDPYINLGKAYYDKGNFEKKVFYTKKAAILGDEEARRWLKQNGYTW
ncbi:MAG: tetratricopeptide repeat protein [Bacteroidota bacterium]|nr:tetratricopeptide repeat protein [Bacteroidota bacterium]